MSNFYLTMVLNVACFNDNRLFYFSLSFWWRLIWKVSSIASKKHSVISCTLVYFWSRDTECKIVA